MHILIDPVEARECIVGLGWPLVFRSVAVADMDNDDVKFAGNVEAMATLSVQRSEEESPTVVPDIDWTDLPAGFVRGWCFSVHT